MIANGGLWTTLEMMAESLGGLALYASETITYECIQQFAIPLNY